MIELHSSYSILLSILWWYVLLYLNILYFIFNILYLTGKFRHSFDGIKGVSFDGLTSRGIDRDRISFSSTGLCCLLALSCLRWNRLVYDEINVVLSMMKSDKKKWWWVTAKFMLFMISFFMISKQWSNSLLFLTYVVNITKTNEKKTVIATRVSSFWVSVVVTIILDFFFL